MQSGARIGIREKKGTMGPPRQTLQALKVHSASIVVGRTIAIGIN